MTRLFLLGAPVVIAYRPGDPSRVRPFELVTEFWAETGQPVTVSGAGELGALYNCGQSKNRVPPGPLSDVLVFADADTVPRSPAQVSEAVWKAREPGLVFCADVMRCLTQLETEQLTGWRDALDRPGEEARATDSMSGLVAIRRDCFLEAGGFDETYLGYGFEDLDFHRRCGRLWPHRWITGEAIHFWHRPDPEKAGRGRLYRANEARWTAGAAA